MIKSNNTLSVYEFLLYIPNTPGQIISKYPLAILFNGNTSDIELFANNPLIVVIFRIYIGAIQFRYIHKYNIISISVRDSFVYKYNCTFGTEQVNSIIELVDRSITG